MNRHRHRPVPRTTEVVPGAAVNIVLKADQPTGRTVSGTVRDVLTRGDHPRGIKVRLADGRVGRLQSMASSSSPSSSSAAVAASSSGPGAAAAFEATGGADGVQTGRLGNDGEDGSLSHQHAGGFGARAGGQPRGGWPRGLRDANGIRLDSEQELPAQQIGLDAYVKQPKPKRRGKGKPSTRVEEEDEGAPPPTGTATCPVCGVFEGDEAAVAHHVATHFES